MCCLLYIYRLAEEILTFTLYLVPINLTCRSRSLCGFRLWNPAPTNKKLFTFKQPEISERPMWFLPIICIFAVESCVVFLCFSLGTTQIWHLDHDGYMRIQIVESRGVTNFFTFMRFLSICMHKLWWLFGWCCHVSCVSWMDKLQPVNLRKKICNGENLGSV